MGIFNLEECELSSTDGWSMMNSRALYSPMCRWILLMVLAGLFESAAIQRAEAAIVNLSVSISENTFLNGANGQPLALDSVVYVIVTQESFSWADFGDQSSAQAVNTDGGPIDSSQPTEVLVGTIRINDGVGQFFPTSVGLVDISVYTHTYLRFFDYQGSTPVVGSNIAWGVSATVTNVNQGFGFAEATLTVTADIQGTNTFSVIPEPGTFQLILLSGTLLFLLGGTGFGRNTIRKLGSG